MAAKEPKDGPVKTEVRPNSKASGSNATENKIRKPGGKVIGEAPSIVQQQRAREAHYEEHRGSMKDVHWELIEKHRDEDTGVGPKFVSQVHQDKDGKPTRYVVSH